MLYISKNRKPMTDQARAQMKRKIPTSPPPTRGQVGLRLQNLKMAAQPPTQKILWNA